jgi:hypothetical protein
MTVILNHRPLSERWGEDYPVVTPRITEQTDDIAYFFHSRTVAIMHLIAQQIAREERRIRRG